MITPAEIQDKEFTKGLRGYDVEEVDMFLDVITLDYEKMIKENLNLKAQIATMEKESVCIPGSDVTVKDTLETAQKLMDDLAKSSEKRANSLIENAEMDAAIIIKDAKMKAEQIAMDSQELIAKYEFFKREYKALLERHIGDFDSINETIEIDRLKAILEDKKLNSTSTVTKEATIIDERFFTDEVSSVSDEEIKVDDRKTIVNIKYE
ncbi:MAG: DivIVA domain-containing protein [Eubacteriales bacterium]|nr:DivIVA domain-containing protein [Eubacteriales bacterium]MDY3332762.1 DivIVA domain-containing protein [Gallibacter sp.]